MKQKLILLALVMGLTIVSQSSLSLGMGKIQVYSALNEPLQSSIDLLANADEELLNLEVKLASSEDYQRVGLDRSFVPANIIVAFDEDNPTKINVTSNGPISEPIVSLLLDVNWNNGRILREFTILLDPPVYESANTSATVSNVTVESVQSNVVTAPVSETQPQIQSQETRTYTNQDVISYQESNTESTVASRPVYNSSSANEVYVEAGDTLWRIANNNKVGGLSAQQMMMAIYNKNPSAFIDNNINQLIKGSRLDMPTSDEADDIGFSEALAQVKSHHQSWSPAQQDYNTYQTEDATDTEYQEPTSTLDYGVQLSGGDNQGSDDGQSNGDDGTDVNVQAIEEDLYNKDAENSELKERISQLEDIVEQQQDVIEISDDGLANLENQLENKVDETLDEASQVINDSVDDVWDSTTETVENVTEDAVDGLSLNVDDVNTSADTESSLVDDVSETTEVNDEGTTEQSVEAETVPVKTPTVTRPAKESFVDTAINWVMDNLMWVLGGLAGLIALLFLPRVFRGGDDDEDETSFLDDIKNRKKETEENEINEVDTKMNQPLADIDEEPLDEAGDDVLAELDRSIDFDEPELQEDTVENLFTDTVEELEENTDFDHDEEDGFDLDGFLNDESTDDSTITKDHSSTLEGASFDDVTEDLAETKIDTDLDTDLDAGLDADLDADLNTDLDTDLGTDLGTDLDTSLDINLDDTDDMSFDDLDLGDDLEDLSADVEKAVEDVNLDAIENDVLDDIEETVDEVKDEVDEFSFDDDEDFDFDLNEELDDLEQVEDEVEDSDEFNDMLDISDSETETFDTVDDGVADMDEEIDLGLEDLMEDTDAIDTKLDLAKAYIDMGDAEGAKNLLDEIFSEGTEEQISEAKKLLDDM